jgi:hypothetical protein
LHFVCELCATGRTFEKVQNLFQTNITRHSLKLFLLDVQLMTHSANTLLSNEIRN